MSQAAILIKNKSGQLKAVDLVSRKIINNQQLTVNNQQEISDKKLENERQKTETGLPAGDLSFGRKLETEEKKQEVEDKKLQSEAKEVLKPMAKEMVMPAFYFNREDEEEAAQYKNSENVRGAAEYKNLIGYITDQIMADSRVSVEVAAKERLIRAMESRLREVRDLLETKEVLVRPANLGGVGLDKDSANRVMHVIEEYRLRLMEEKDKIGIEKKGEIKETEIRNWKLETGLPAGDLSFGRKLETEKPTIKTMAPATPVKVVTEVVAPIINKPSYAEAVTRAWQADKPAGRLMGPAEELGSISLENFRALGKNITEVLAKIKDKIDLLTDESYEKRAEGIRYWRLSPVYQEYLVIGRQSVESGQGVEQIIKQKEMAHQPTLTLEEFQAIADLNEELTY